MKRMLTLALVLALAPLAWAGDDDSDKDTKALRDRILKRVDEQLAKEFDRIRTEVKALLDKELGLEKKGAEAQKPPASSEKPPEKKQPKEHAAKPPEEKGTEKPASHEKKPGWLGVQLGQDEESGKPSIAGVFPETPAEKAGLKEGDILQKLNGKDIDDVQSLIETVKKSGPGAELKFTVLRGGDSVDVKVKLTERPAEMDNPEPPDDEEGKDDLGKPEKKK